MREQSHRHSSFNAERGDFRPGPGKSKSSVTRSRRATNLGRLSKVLGLDLLGAALGLSPDAMSILVDGRDHAREQQYAAHLAAKFKDAGIPSTWLDNQDAQVAPDYLHRLRQFAAASSNKIPTRRANFYRLTKAFSGREELLADALEMIPSAVLNVAEGRLDLDDGRFGHINPRLVRANFPDGWLEQAEPDLTDAMLQSLEQLATDEYERSFEEQEQDQLSHAGQVFVSPTVVSEEKTQTNMQPEAAQSDKSKETAMASQRKPATTPSQAPTFKAAGMPTTKPMGHPTAGSRPLPRNMMTAGRPLGTAVTKAVAPPAKAPSMKVPSAMPVMPRAVAPMPVAPVKKAKAATPIADAPVETVKARTIAPRNTVSKEVSMARAIALEEVLKISRRGVKSTLWRDILHSSLPFWGNIRRGTVLFRDELAEGAVKALGLPEGWLDNPSYPPETLAAWVTDETAPMPTALEINAETQPTDTASPAPAAEAVAKPKRDVTKPYAQSKAPAPGKVTMTSTPPAKPPVFPGAAAKVAALAKMDEIKPTYPRALVDTKALESSVQAGQAAVAAAAAAAKTEPATVAVAVAAVSGPTGPLCKALLSIITAKSAEGTFTEGDALSLINKLMS